MHESTRHGMAIAGLIVASLTLTGVTVGVMATNAIADPNTETALPADGVTSIERAGDLWTIVTDAPAWEIKYMGNPQQIICGTNYGNPCTTTETFSTATSCVYLQVDWAGQHGHNSSDPYVCRTGVVPSPSPSASVIPSPSPSASTVPDPSPSMSSTYVACDPLVTACQLETLPLQELASTGPGAPFLVFALAVLVLIIGSIIQAQTRTRIRRTDRQRKAVHPSFAPTPALPQLDSFSPRRATDHVNSTR